MMTKRFRYIWLVICMVAGGILAFGAWHHSPDADPDNQGGYAIVLLLFVVSLFVYVPTVMRWAGARLRARPTGEA